MRSLSTAVKLFGILFILTGIIYPFIIMVIATTAFPEQAHGSLILNDNGTVIGSKLIGQNFSLPRYFQSRPSATPGSAYNAGSSGGSNLGPTNPVLLEQVALRIQVLQKLGISQPIPSDLVTTSASGLDPHISLEAALIQVPVVARERMIDEDIVKALVLSDVEWSTAPFTQPYVNVFSLNQALDQLSGKET